MKKIMFLALWGVAACSAPSPTQSSSRLTSSADAQHLGIAAYAVDADSATLFDRDGIELARITASAPAPGTRVFTAEYADGTTDEADVGRPMADGSFLAPVTPETMLTAALADAALAPLWAAHDVRFVVDAQSRLRNATGVLNPSSVANTFECSSYSCTGSSCTPLGCAKPANTSVGCTNVSDLPATVQDNTTWTQLSGNFTSSVACNNGVANACKGAYGGSAGDWVRFTTTSCTPVGDGFYAAVCLHGSSSNSWIASCPPEACTAPNYDAVPRNGDCLQPGSCTYSTGTVTCTTEH